MSRTPRALLLAPALGIVGLVLVAPMLLLLAVSFWQVKTFRLQPAFSLQAWERFVVSYGGLTLYTLLVGAVTAALCVAIGLAFAYGARFKAGRFADALVIATLISLFGGYLVKIYAWKSILGADGIVNQALIGLGLRSEPVSWLLYSKGAVIVTLVSFLLPFAILPIYAAIRNVSATSLEAARDLGATRAQAFWRIVVPQCRAGLFSAAAFVFLLAAGDYVTPMLLGGNGGAMLGQFIALEFSSRFNWPAGAAMSFGLLAASLVVIGLGWALLRPGRRA